MNWLIWERWCITWNWIKWKRKRKKINIMKILNSNNASPVTENSSIEIKKSKWKQNKNCEQRVETFSPKMAIHFKFFTPCVLDPSNINLLFWIDEENSPHSLFCLNRVWAKIIYQLSPWRRKTVKKKIITLWEGKIKTTISAFLSIAKSMFRKMF